jgi:putative nucleotidyltransferase with HDIG domain
MIYLDDLIRQVNELAPLPVCATRLAGLICNPDFDLDEVTELIAFDSALTLKLLRAANSAANATATRIGSVREAVTMMGAAQILALAVAASTKPILIKPIPQYGLGEGALWRHSVAAAAAAETLQAFGSIALPPEAFTAALLHDIGKLVLGQFLNSDALRLVEQAKEKDHLDEMESELLLLNVHHAELGGLIAQHWNLPPQIVRGITYHHNPKQGLDIISDVTYLTNHLAKHIEANLSGQKFDLAIPPEIAEHLDLSPKMLESLCPLAVLRYEQVSRRYNAL